MRLGNFRKMLYLGAFRVLLLYPYRDSPVADPVHVQHSLAKAQADPHVPVIHYLQVEVIWLADDLVYSARVIGSDFPGAFTWGHPSSSEFGVNPHRGVRLC
jgi:hypothetical protein